jgi:DNA-binding transcriptional MerR regulator
VTFVTAQPVDETTESDDATVTIDELASRAGLTVRTTRYYASLGLLPPPVRRGRVAYYTERHRVRLDLIRTMQERGLTLGAIEQYLRAMPQDTPARDVELRRSLIASWAPLPPTNLDRAGLDQRAGRRLTDPEVDYLVDGGYLDRTPTGFEARPTIDVALAVLDLDLPLKSIEAAGAAIRQHMEALALELRDVMRKHVLPEVRSRLDADPQEFERTMSRLRQLTLEAVASAFQTATDGLVDGSLLTEH